MKGPTRPNASICHASEDKETVAQPFARAPRKFVDVRFDESRLKVGEILRVKTDVGLAKSGSGADGRTSNAPRACRSNLGQVGALQGT